MDLLEYQGKRFFDRFGIPIPAGEAADTAEEAVAAAERIGFPAVVKAQVHIGGRGKAGGIRVARDASEARAAAGDILGMDIKGHRVDVLWVEEASDVAAEFYASFTLDRSARRHLGILSAQGGVDIEQVAESDPEAIAKIWVDPLDGLDGETARRWVADARLPGEAAEQAADILRRLYAAYVEGDADLVEINPLALTKDGRVLALDAKVSLDANSMFRHEHYRAFDATQPRDERETAARERGLQYVGLDGYVGVIANGAGLAMSTVDVVHQTGGAAANFLDIGGGADVDTMAAALEVINNDPAVRSIFINIFGGIVKGEVVAQGILDALQRVTMRSPIVLRLDGTNADQGREMLQPRMSDMLQLADSMLDGAAQAVAIAQAGAAPGGGGGR